MRLHTLGPNVIVGDEGDNTLSGADGNDLIKGRGGDDDLRGGGGYDRLYGAEGADTLDGGADDVGDLLSGGSGDDLIFGRAGDTLSGGAGIDRLYIDLWQDTAGVAGSLAGMAKGGMVSLSNGMVLRGMESGELILGSGNDDIRIGKLAINVTAGFGDDQVTVGGDFDRRLDGGAGDDTVHGSGGRDWIVGGSGDDVMFGGRGVDMADYYSGDSSSGVTIDLRLTGPQDTHGAGIDTLTAIEDIWGTTGSDVLIGGEEANDFLGEFGDDVLIGGGGDDMLAGDYDVWPPDAANADLIDGGAGADRLWGGMATDTFVFHAVSDSTNGHPDTILDLDNHATTDIIDISGIDADIGEAGNQAFHLVEGHFTGHAAEALLTYEVGGTVLRLDVDGDGQADSTILIAGDHRDFVNFVL